MKAPTENTATPQEPQGDGCMARLVRLLHWAEKEREEAMEEWLNEEGGTPNSLHFLARQDAFGSVVRRIKHEQCEEWQITGMLDPSHPKAGKSVLVAFRTDDGMAWMVGVCIKPKSHPEQLWFRRDGDHDGLFLRGPEGPNKNYVGFIYLPNSFIERPVALHRDNLPVD